MNEDWDLLVSFFPDEWRDLAQSSGALKGLRRDKDAEKLLRTLLLHVGCGFSLRETVVRARRAELADLSDVALLKRLRKCEGWLQSLCGKLFVERGLDAPDDPLYGALRLVDATHVREPGKTGSLWRLHYSLSLPSLRCDFFELTPAKGKGTGESLSRFPANPGDHILADRGYSTAKGIFSLAGSGADLTVRLCPGNVRLTDRQGLPLDLPQKLKSLNKPDQVGEWEAIVSDSHDQCRTPGRLCVLRKSRAAADLAKKRLMRRGQKNGEQIGPDALFHCEFVILFTTVPSARLCASKVLDLYRVRWQVELVFKRFKQLAGLGHVPKHDDASTRAWLYGKLFVALLSEKIISHAETLSPWGYCLRQEGRNP